MIEIKSLTIADASHRAVVDAVSLGIAEGERVAVVGESGSGKTTLALALLGAVRPGLRIAHGSIMAGSVDVLSLGNAALRRWRGRVVSYLPQEPAAALTPTLRVRRQLSELATVRTENAVARRLTDVGLPGDREFQRRYPHQLSGGQQQRLALARTCSADPRVLILDEPTTGLDAVAQNGVIDQLDALVRSRALTLLFITHDLAAAARIADRLVVMESGRLVEQGPLRRVLDRPAQRYTRALLQAIPRPPSTAANPGAATPVRDPAAATAPVLSVLGLHAGYRQSGRRIPVVGDVSFDLSVGECVALLGRSGSGKTTVARCVSGMHRPDAGAILLDGVRLPARAIDRPPAARRRIQVIPQDAAGSLNPRRTVGAAVARPLRLRGVTGAAAEARVRELLRMVGLDASHTQRLPGRLSGGQRQRVTIARALAAEPSVLVCDEMTSSLDVRVQADVLDLVDRLREELGLAILLITHDLGVMARLADWVLVLREGGVCEAGQTARVLGAPSHPWTRELLAAAARADSVLNPPASVTTTVVPRHRSPDPVPPL